MLTQWSTCRLDTPPPHTHTPQTTYPKFCDLGTLRDAVLRGQFHAELHGGAVGVDILGVVEVGCLSACRKRFGGWLCFGLFERELDGGAGDENVSLMADSRSSAPLAPRLGSSAAG